MSSDPSIVDSTSSPPAKIVGIGLNKTGTGTLKTCMRYWGSKHATYDLDAFGLYRAGDTQALEALMDSHDSFENWPWALMYEHFDKRYPDVKFILTLRKDPQTWFRSLCNHFRRMGPLVDFEQYIYGHANPCDNEQAHLDYYQCHNQQVLDYFADRPGKLLVLCWDKGDGWAELCEFLGRAIPDIAFPHANKTPTLWDRVERGLRPRLGRVKQKILSALGR